MYIIMDLRLIKSVFIQWDMDEHEQCCEISYLTIIKF